MTTSVTVTTGARLHFGLLVGAGPNGPTYRSVGMMIAEPGYTLTASPATTDVITAGPETTVRIVEFLARWRRASAPSPVNIDVAREIPAHAGLGSGTQLGLALGAVLNALYDQMPLNADDITQRMERGRRSSIGRVGFACGGFLMTGEKSSHGAASEEIIRHEVPAEWRVVLVTPGDRSGLSGTDELRAFQQLPPMKPEQLESLAQLAVDEWAPAIRDTNFHAAAEAMLHFGTGVGRYFAPVQGGIYAHPAMERLAQEVRHAFGYGVAQTSWGPTLAILCPSSEAATDLSQWLQQQSTAQGSIVRTAAPLNRGATITVA